MAVVMFTINLQLPTVGFEPRSSHTAVRHVTARPLQPTNNQPSKRWREKNKQKIDVKSKNHVYLSLVVVFLFLFKQPFFGVTPGYLFFELREIIGAELLTGRMPFLPFNQQG